MVTATIWQRWLSDDRRMQCLRGLALFGVAAAYLALLSFSSEKIFTRDGFYHIKFAYLMRTESLFLTLKWLPLTIGGTLGVDHHWLFHVMLIPFTFTDDLALGLRLASIFYGSLCVVSVFAFLTAYRVRWAAVWSVFFLLISEQVALRFLMARAGTVAIPLLLIYLHMVLRGSRVGVGLTTFVFTLTYGISVILVPLVLVYTVVQHLNGGSWRLNPLLYTALGTALGLVINPFFPNSLEFFFFLLLNRFSAAHTAIGGEWYPLTTWDALLELWPLFVVGLATVMDGINSRKGLALESLLVMVITMLFFVLFCQHKRFIEYLVPLGCLFCALYWRDAWPERLGTWASLPRLLRYATVSLGVLALLGLGVTKHRDSRRYLATNGLHPSMYKREAQWLKRHTPKDSLVFNVDFDSFALLFFHNHHNRYVSGLDPVWLSYGSPELFPLYQKISRGKFKGDIATVLTKQFKTHVVVGPNLKFYDHLGRTVPVYRFFRKRGLAFVLRSEWGFVARVTP